MAFGSGQTDLSTRRRRMYYLSLRSLCTVAEEAVIVYLLFLCPLAPETLDLKHVH